MGFILTPICLLLMIWDIVEPTTESKNIGKTGVQIPNFGWFMANAVSLSYQVEITIAALW